MKKMIIYYNLKNKKKIEENQKEEIAIAYDHAFQVVCIGSSFMIVCVCVCMVYFLFLILIY